MALILQNRIVIGGVYRTHVRRTEVKEKKIFGPKPILFGLNPNLILDRERGGKSTKMESGGKGINKQKHKNTVIRDFGGGPVVKNLPSNPRDAAAIPELCLCATTKAPMRHR